MRYVNFIGLLLGLIGVIFIFVWGPPQPSFQEYVAVAVDGKIATDVAEKAKGERRLYATLSRIGLGFIMVGFAFQAVASWPRRASAAAKNATGAPAASAQEAAISSTFKEQHLIETYKSLIPIAVGALRAVMLLNGGAAVALLAFLGSVVRGGQNAPHVDMRWPMGLFVIGVALSGASHIAAYLTQLALYNESLSSHSVPRWRRHMPWLWGTIILVILSMGAFIWGAMSAVMKFAI